MKNIFFIALNTVKEVRHSGALLVLGIFIFFMGMASLLLGPLSLNEQARLTINFTFTACHIGLVLMAVYFSSVLILGEIESKTALTLFSKPVSRAQFVMGKFGGLCFMLLFCLLFVSAFVVGAHILHGRSVSAILFIALYGVFLEALFFTALGFFFSSFSRAFVILVCSFFVFLIGHSLSGALFLLQKSSASEGLINTFFVLSRFFPNLERFNWRTHALYQDFLSSQELFFSSLYALCWIVCLLIGTVFLLNKRKAF